MKDKLIGAAIALVLVTTISFVFKQQIIDDTLVKKVHHQALTIDSHVDIRNDFNTQGNDAGSETIDQIDLPKLERGDLDIATIALQADPARPTPENFTAAREQVNTKYEALQRWVNSNPSRLEFVKTSSDLNRIADKGKHGILLSFLNAYWFNKDLSLIDSFYNKGVRLFGFAHAGNNDFTGSSRPIEAYGDKPGIGLSQLGEQGIRRLNKLGVIIDVSQLSTPALLQTIAITRAPVIASHSAVRGRVDNARNLNNEELKAIAKNGGVVQIVAFAGYLKTDSSFFKAYLKEVAEPFGIVPLKDDPRTKLSAEDYKKYLAAYLQFSRSEWRFASIGDYLDAVDYAVRLIGIDHVGLSTDFNHGGGVTGFANEGEAVNVTRELLRRGYSEEDIQKLWGNNFLRVFRKVEAVAKGN